MMVDIAERKVGYGRCLVCGKVHGMATLEQEEGGSE